MTIYAKFHSNASISRHAK